MKGYLEELRQQVYRQVAASNPLEIPGQTTMLKAQGKIELLNDMMSDIFVDKYLEHINKEEPDGRRNSNRRP
jgi:hypothetical protein